MAEIKVAVINDSTVLTDRQVQDVVPVLEFQVHKHFSRAWGIDADLRFVPRPQEPGADEWQLVILDDSDRGEDLGYHELTNTGQPLCKVFARSDQTRGYQWTVTASHELLEMLGDPNASLGVLVQPNACDSFLYAYEVCDPCESEAFAYAIPQPGGGPVLVSDFVYPAWFEPLREARSTQFDFGGHIDAPLQCLPGSHMDVFDINCRVWRRYLGEGQPYRYEPRSLLGTRRERRRRPRNRWRRSTVVHAHARRPGGPPSGVELASGVLDQISSSIDALKEAIDRLDP